MRGVNRVREVLNHYGIYFEDSPGSDELFYLCPFHDDHDVGSAMFNESREVFHCFSCGEGGNIYEFVVKMEGCDFRQAELLIDNNFQPPGQYDLEITAKIVNKRVVTGVTSAQYQVLVDKAVERLLQVCNDRKPRIEILNKVIAECCFMSSLQDTDFEKRYRDTLSRYTELYSQINSLGEA